MPSALNNVYGASFILVTEFTSNICLLILSRILKLSESLQTFETKLKTTSLSFSLHGSLVATLQADTVTLPHTQVSISLQLSVVSVAHVKENNKNSSRSREWLSCVTSTYPNHVYSNHSNNINIVMRSCTHILDRIYDDLHTSVSSSSANTAAEIACWAPHHHAP